MEISETVVEKLKALPLAAQKAVLDVIDFLTQRKHDAPSGMERPPLNFPVDHWGSWPSDLSLRRDDLYDQRGR